MSKLVVGGKSENFNILNVFNKPAVNDDVLKQDKLNLEKADEAVAYYHANIQREVAESMLLDFDRKERVDGRFLLRDSRTKVNDKVITMIVEGKVYHFHVIHKFENCFQIDFGPVIQGIDKLIKHHQTQPAGLPCCLTTFVPGKPPPDSLRCYGQTNHLHKAVREQSTKLCAKRLSSKECPDIDMKDAEGDTALHIACKIGSSNIVKLLLKYGAKTNIKNSEQCTPFQIACNENHHEIVSDLLNIGHCDPHERCAVTGLYAMHELAQKGHQKCIQILLQNFSPAYPRSLEEITPLDIAKKNNHIKCVKLFEKHIDLIPKTKSEHWLHPELERQGAMTLLRRYGSVQGMFLIRRSKWHDGWYVMSLCHGGHIFHFEIKNCEYFGKSMYYIDNGPYISSLELLVHHYNIRFDGLPCLLKTGLSIEHDRNTIPNLHEKLSVLKSEAPESPTNLLPQWKMNAPKSAPPPVPTTNPPVRPTFRPTSNEYSFHFIDSKDIKKGGFLGEGEFGEVMKGVLTTIEGKKTVKITVALKTFTDNVVNSQSDFCREAEIMMKLNHECITKLIGVCQEPLMLVEEYVPKGSMLDFLLDYPSKVDVKIDLILWASQIALGMIYLESRKMIHRDLAARNILLASKKQIKISDFGLSRAVGENQYYRAASGGKWPIKWYAIEAVKYGQFSHATDVWSFGVTLWEMFTFGEAPYHDMKGIEVMKYLEEGKRLVQPKRCPDAIYKIMLECWQENSKDRPTFNSLMNKLNLMKK